ncbi:ABC-F family ATP-binding cassette domain-containing protein [Sphingomonas sp. AOB5]|uniref:ABC-F family ATP-binding cassette domain-containing protein n=1 Tax=Sphingomonas sp. AOB5 TaxID=3034017 RepID=UPI0023F8F0D5|nr:ABC-F family ATP-binding cassette domain-containing protein [Sphingomonas sp. AOB5]MDF7774143.1 ABC-F family ATP-binding cassette domain-containing protein [Sphingomonas sp. AOB5]
MSAVTLSNLSWSTPDGVPVLSDLNLGFAAERTGLVGRNGAGKTSLLRLLSGDLQPQSGSVTVAGTIATLRQSLAPQSGETVATLFGVADALALLRRAESGEATMDELAEADWTLESRIESALAQLRLDTPLDTPLASLSGGQRTRAALAAAIFADPDFLLLDEPTNNLDRDGRDAVLSLLAGWRAGAIVVSHDRELLDTMDAIVELNSLGATRYGGNWSAYRERKALELAAARHDLADAERRVAEAARTAQQQAERKARKDGAGKRKAAKGDIPKIVLGMMKNRAENSSGEAARLAERQRSEARDAASTAREKIEILQPLTVSLPPSGLPANRNVLEIRDATTGYDRAILSGFSLDLTGPERVAVTGPNGSGKSTLLALITGRLQPWSGTVRVTDRVAMLDQHANILDPSASIRDNFTRLNPGATENACRAALARFAFRADAALQIAGTLSGGQRLRAALACTLGGETPPWLLILDEPTNHLDIESIEAVEAGLIAYDGALLVVSHDTAFLEAIAVERRIALPDGETDPARAG